LNREGGALLEATVLVHDETSSGQRTHSIRLRLVSERLTAAELISRRVTQEVEEYNASTPEYFRGLVEPTRAEAVLNGPKIRERRRLDPQAQCETALRAFQTNGFFLLVDDRQVEELDEVLVLSPESEVRFVKLVPLVGG
jgi:hypothetical protein